MRRSGYKRMWALILSGAMLISTLNGYQAHAEVLEDGTYLLSENRPAYSSSVNGGDNASYATDGKLNTQWGAAANKNDQWLDVDLGAKANIKKVEIDWQNNAAYGVVYDVKVSDDEINWTTIYTTDSGDGGDMVNVLSKDGESVDYTYYKDVLSGLSGNGRYIRVQIKYSKSQYDNSEKMGWGASIREFKVYGNGGVNKPKSNETNIALGKTVTVSSSKNPWWASAPLDGKNSVDGDYDTYWLSDENNDEWYILDLGQVYTIGRILLQWQVEYGRIFEIQLSEDGENYEPFFRSIDGNGEDEEIELYGKARYIKMQGIAMGRGSGYSIREMQVFEYVEGDSKVNPVLPALPEEYTVQMGEGSYGVDDKDLYQPRTPKYVTDNVSTPIPSNDWWTSVIYTRLSDTMPALPFVYRYSENGLGMYYADKTYTRTNNGGMGADSKYFDLTVGTSAISGTPSARYDSAGDWSANIVFSDNDTEKLKSTIIKGSPYVYNSFSDPSSAEIVISDLVKFFDENGEITLNDGQTYTGDRLGVEVHNESESPEDEDKNQYHFYGLYVPAGTSFTRVGSKLKINLGNGDNYMTVAALSKESDFTYMYQHAYAVVTDTSVSYEFSEASSNMKTHYNVTVDLKRSGFSNKTVMCMFPTQWKYSDDEVTSITYNSIRGTLKAVEANSFSYGLKFNGIIPAYDTPSESSYYDEEEMRAYLQEFYESSIKDYWVADPYWQGKKTHPIAMGILIAEQLGEYEIRDELISILRKILVNWYTYDGSDDSPYYLYYHTSWGAISGDGGDHGMAINLSDHHFLWAYFIFPSAVLASYDSQFVEDYGDMVELLIRDCMNPDKDDELLPYMRNFDVYEGHSWAGGYGDNNSGNNQESASEATFAWAGLYLWGLVTKNDTYRDAGIWGYTSEVNAIEQYWFNYDGDNWDEDYTVSYVGMVWGLGYTNGTYFSGNPSCIYGIHLLPVTPAIAYMGYNHEKAAELYEGYEKEQEAYQNKLITEGATDPEGWFHILWPNLSLSDPDEAAQRWNTEITSHTNENGDYVDGNLPNDEKFNSYWFIQNMCAKGLVATDVWSDNYSCCQFFEKNGKYTAEVWNPYDETITVTFRDKNGRTGQTKVAAHGLVSVDPYAVTDMSSETVKAVENVDKVYDVPGVLEAENYYTNFSCMKDTNETEGEYIGWIDDGDSLLFDVNVEEEADYSIEYRFISTSDEKIGKITMSTDLSGKVATTTLNDVKKWNNVKDTVHLKAGRQMLTLKFDTAGFNLNYVKIYKVGTKAPVAESDDLTQADLSAYQEINLTGSVVTASSEQGWNYDDNIIDGDYNTRWESEFADPQWIQLELPQEKLIEGIKIYWEGAAAKNYTVEVSEDGVNYETAFTRKNGTGGSGYGDDKRSSGLESIELAKAYKAKYIRINGTARTTGYGYSIYEMKLYGGDSEIVETDSLQINGFQISTNYNGFRTVYTNTKTIADKTVTETGLVFAIDNEVQDEDIYVGSKTASVYSFAGSQAGILADNSKITDLSDADSRVMTMRFAAGSAYEFTTKMAVRAYAKLEDGSYVYSNVERYSIYDVAVNLYKNKKMPTQSSHDYLYDKIISIVGDGIERIGY